MLASTRTWSATFPAGAHRLVGSVGADSCSAPRWQTDKSAMCELRIQKGGLLSEGYQPNHGRRVAHRYRCWARLQKRAVGVKLDRTCARLTAVAVRRGCAAVRPKRASWMRSVT